MAKKHRSNGGAGDEAGGEYRRAVAALFAAYGLNGLPFPDLPFYMSFDMFTPIPKAKDTKDQYKNNPLATGPYQFDSYTPGAELKLKRNPNWDPKTDPLRHAYPDAWEISTSDPHGPRARRRPETYV